MSSNTLASPSESSIVRYFVLFLGCIFTLAIPIDLITSGVTVTWSQVLLGDINFPYPIIQNFNLRIIIEVFLGPYITLWSIQKIKPDYDTSILIRLLSVFWGVIFVIFGSLGVLSSVLGISLFGVSNNLITYIAFVYGFVILLYVWREDLPNIYTTLLAKINALISLLSQKTVNLFVLFLGIGLLILVPLEVFWHEISIVFRETALFGVNLSYPAIINIQGKVFLEIFFGSMFVIKALPQIRPNLDLLRLSKILSTFWSIIFILVGILGFFSSVINNSIFGISNTPSSVFFLVFGLLYLLFVWQESVKDSFSRIVSQRSLIIEKYNLPQITTALIFMIGFGLTLIIPLEFLSSKVTITWQGISFVGITFSYPTISNLNLRIFLELLSGPLILLWSSRRINVYNSLQKIKELENY